MADQNQRISDLLDTLTDASSEAIETALRIFEPADVAAVVAERALAGGGGSGGGSSPVTDSASVTTDPDTFLASHTFDLEGVATVYVNQTVTALVADGETYGNSDGDVAVGGGALANMEVSRDGTTWYPFLSVVGAFLVSVSDMYAVAQHRDAVILCPRYLRVNLSIDDWTEGAVYAGANHPTATVLIAVEAAT